MNQAIQEACSKPGDAEKGSIEIRPAVPFVSEAMYDSMEKDKGKFVEITCRVTDETFLASLNRVRDYYFKKYAARYQVAYLRQNLRKPKEVSVRTCATRLQEINNYLLNFPGPDLNTPLAEGEIISILVAMIPSAWHRKMVSINFEPLTKKFIEVIEYLEQLEVLDATEKKQAQKKSEAENKSKEKSKGKGKSQKKGAKGQNKKRKAESDETDEDSKFCAYCKGKGGKYQTHNVEDCWFIKNLGNKGSNKKPKYQNKNSKEFNALVKAQVQKNLKQSKKNKNKDQSPSESETNSSGEE